MNGSVLATDVLVAFRKSVSHTTRNQEIVGITEGQSFSSPSSSCGEYHRLKGAARIQRSPQNLVEMCKDQLNLEGESHQRLEWVCAAGSF